MPGADCLIGMKRLLAVVTGWALLVFPGRACIWSYHTELNGSPVAINGISPEYWLRDARRGHDRELERWQSREAELRDRWAGLPFQEQSDYAAALLHLGQAEQALPILEKLAQEHPDEYVVAANLGTAYELAGQNEKALAWISRGLELNEDSHYGTEWLHVRILQAKIALAQEPDWLARHSVLGLDFGQEPAPRRPAELSSKEKRKDLESALRYQLRERLPLVGPPDATVSDLLFDWGNLVAAFSHLEGALPLYKMALEYGSHRAEIIQARQAHFETVIRRGSFRKLFASYFGTYGKLGPAGPALGIATLAILGWLAIRISRSFRRRRAAL